MARPSNKAERRSQIARGLMKVMAERGYDGASVAEVAAAAELTPGLVHYHFKNKQEILVAALEELVTDHTGRLDAFLDEVGGDPCGQLAAFVDFHLRLGDNADPIALACWLVISGEAMRRDEVRTAFEGAIAEYTQRAFAIISQGVRDNLFTCDQPEAAASALVAAVQGFFVLAATARNQVPKGTAARSVRQMADGLLQPTRSIATIGSEA